MDERTVVARVSGRRRLQRLEVIYAAVGVGLTLPATVLVARVVAGPAFYRYGFTAWTVPGLFALIGATVDVRYAGQPLGRAGRFVLYAAAAVQAMATLFYSPVGSVVYLPAVLLAFGACVHAHRASGRVGIDGAVRVRDHTEGHVMVSGTIKRVETHGGFGFIKAEDDQEYFFHRSGLDRSLAFEDLRGGERVIFDADRGPKGLRAARVRLAP